LLMQHFLKDLTIMLSGMAFHAADNHRATSERAARKGQLKERCANKLFFRLRNRQKLVRVRFGCRLDLRIYGNSV
jgi:predicted AAA+ superfamily ATPase